MSAKLGELALLTTCFVASDLTQMLQMLLLCSVMRFESAANRSDIR